MLALDYDLLRKYNITSKEQLLSLIEKNNKEKWGLDNASEYLQKFYYRMIFHIYMEFYDDGSGESENSEA